MMKVQPREYLLQIPFWTKEKHSLDTVRDFLEALGNPEQKLEIIHVAGTNGKGSVCADMTAMLLEAGYTVGTFVSPHLIDVTERFLVNGKPVDEEAFTKSFERVWEVTQTMLERGYSHPTFFEFVFFMAMELYGRLCPDYVILEVGLGGRLDATNVIRTPIASVITSISFDHTGILGNTIQEIAAEKAGIIKAGIPVIYDDHRAEASKVIGERAAALLAPAFPVSGAEYDYQSYFAAPYQAMDAVLARKTLAVLQEFGYAKRLTEAMCQAALKKVRWQGRMEEAAPDIWLDGAHNPDGIRALIGAVHKQMSEPEMQKKRLQLLFAAVADKDYREMIQMLCKELSLTRVTVVQLASARAADATRLAEQFLQEGCKQVEAYGTAREALEAALSHKTEHDRLYVAGSLYLIGEIKALLLQRQQDEEGDNAGL